MKRFARSSFAVAGDIIRPVFYYTVDQLAQKMLVIGDVFSTEIQYQYAEGVLEMMIESELKDLLAGVVVPGRLEAFKRLLKNFLTLAGQKQEWNVKSSVRELKRHILSAMKSHEDLYYFYDVRQRDLFWRTFADHYEYKRLLGLVVVQRHVLFTTRERVRYISNLSRRVSALYA